MSYNLKVLLMKVKTFFFFCLVYMRCTGGEVGATSSLAPKIGPLGLVSIAIMVQSVLFDPVLS